MSKQTSRDVEAVRRKKAALSHTAEGHQAEFERIKKEQSKFEKRTIKK